MTLTYHAHEFSSRVTQDGRTPLDLAFSMNRNDIIKMLLARGAEPTHKDTLLHYAVSNEDVDLVQMLLELRADPDAKNDVPQRGEGIYHLFFARNDAHLSHAAWGDSVGIGLFPQFENRHHQVAS